MKVLFVFRTTLFTQPGGDTVQIEQTRYYLEKLGYNVVFCSDIEKGYRDFDLIHAFNLTRPADILPFLKSRKPVILSAIHIDYSEFDAKFRSGWSKAAHLVLGKHRFEYLKTMGRWLRGTGTFPGKYYLLRGQRQSIKKVLSRASMVITASDQEKKVIEKDFGPIEKAIKISLGSEHLEGTPDGERKGIICIARIEGLKNQLNLIRAVNYSAIPLKLIGNPASNQKIYFQQCRSEAGPEVIFTGYMDHRAIARELSMARVHAMPSYYETTGLSTIEALKMGCQAVITDRGGQKEIFGEHAFYCDPDNISSIRHAIEKAMQCEEDHRPWIEKTFRWETAAGLISDIYQTVLPAKA